MKRQSKYRKLYGWSLEELSDILRCSTWSVLVKHYKGELREAINEEFNQIRRERMAVDAVDEKEREEILEDLESIYGSKEKGEGDE